MDQIMEDWAGDQFYEELSRIISDYLSRNLKTKYIPLPISRKKSEKSFSSKNIGMIRILGKKGHFLLTVGFSSTKEYQHYQTTLSDRFDSNEDSIREFESELLQSLYVNLKEKDEIKSMDFEENSKSVFLPIGKDLGGWNHISLNKTVELNYHCHEGGMLRNFQLYLTIYSLEEQKKLVQEIYGHPADINILIVDDTIISRQLAGRYLGYAGFSNFTEASDGEDAYQKLISGPGQNDDGVKVDKFDLMVLDWHMPKMSGLELVKKLKQENRKSNLIIIMATSEQRPEEMAILLQEGVDGYVIKPFQPSGLHMAIKRASSLVVQRKSA